MEIHIDKLKSPEDIVQAKKLAALVIKDNFQKEGLDGPEFRGELLEEIMRVQKKFNLSNKTQYHFYVARNKTKLIGTAGYGIEISKPILTALEQSSQEKKSMVELMSFYVNPDFQGRGVGSELLKVVIKDLHLAGCDMVSLYTGYISGRNFWNSKLGEPDVTLPKYFGETDCWVWIKDTSSFAGNMR